MEPLAILTFLAGLSLAPLLLGLITRTKAIAAGRRGASLLQPYRDLNKLLRKGTVYSRTTTWIFRAMPSVGLVMAIGALVLLPLSGNTALLAFEGDLILFAYLLGMMRFFMVLAALDTSSAFEGMGASREVLFSALAEPALLIGLATLAYSTGSYSLTTLFAGIEPGARGVAGPAFLMVSAVLLIVLLAENARIPVDDPETHLELTMIHEVMILDHSGPDLAFLLYTSALKLWLFEALTVNIFLVFLNIQGWTMLVAFAVGMLVLTVVIGIIESVMARLSLTRVPQILIGAVALAIMAFALAVRSGI